MRVAPLFKIILWQLGFKKSHYEEESQKAICVVSHHRLIPTLDISQLLP
jgi:hypothetical protein